MEELKDYSGEFKNDLKLTDFSKDFLVRIMEMWARAYIRLDELWFQLVRERAGEEAATYCRETIWLKVAEATLPKVAWGLGIRVNDVVDVMKVLQLAPDGMSAGVYTSVFDVKSRNHVILTMTRCRTLEWMEKNEPERIPKVCHNIDIPAFERYLTALLPNAQVKPLILRSEPRKSLDEPACKWEYKSKLST